MSLPVQHKRAGSRWMHRRLREPGSSHRPARPQSEVGPYPCLMTKAILQASFMNLACHQRANWPRLPCLLRILCSRPLCLLQQQRARRLCGACDPRGRAGSARAAGARPAQQPRHQPGRRLGDTHHSKPRRLPPHGYVKGKRGRAGDCGTC